jgi:hypothetical protein
MYVCVHGYMHVCVCVRSLHVCMSACIYVCMYVCVCVWLMHVCTYVHVSCICVLMCICALVAYAGILCMYAMYIGSYVCACAYVRKHAFLYVCAYLSISVRMYTYVLKLNVRDLGNVLESSEA